MTAIVLGVSSNGLAVVRSLGRRGIVVHMLDQAANWPYMRSRFGRPVFMPELLLQPEAWLDTIIEIVRNSPDKPILIPTGDDYVIFVSQNRKRLEDYVRFRLPSAEVVELICDKARQYEFLIGAGYAVPKTAPVEAGVDIVQLALAQTGFPCLLKPRFSEAWRRHKTGVKLAIAYDAQQLQLNYEWMTRTGELLILQEFIPGDDTHLHGYLAHNGAEGQALGAFTKQKLRQFPLTSGNGSLQISTHNPELAQIAEAMLRSLSYTGTVSIEFKLDPRDQRYKLMEINPRGVSGNQLPIDCGVDLPYIAYQDMIGAEPPLKPDYRVGVRYLHLGWDVQAFLALRRAGKLTTWQWLRSLWGVRSLAIFNWQDPKPFLFYVFMVAGQLLRRQTRL